MARGTRHPVPFPIPREENGFAVKAEFLVGLCKRRRVLLSGPALAQVSLALINYTCPVPCWETV